MGYYINPPDSVKQNGRKLEFVGNPTFRAAVEQLKDNEHLYLLAQRLDAPFKNCVHLYSDSEFNEFWNQVLRGNIISQGFYAVESEVSGSYYKQEK